MEPLLEAYRSGRTSYPFRRFLRLGGWTVAVVLLAGWLFGIDCGRADEIPRGQDLAGPEALRLSVNEAVALFLRQNIDLLMAKYGIESSKGREITARLFPNPEFKVITLTAFTQKCTLSKCGGIMPSISQMFLVAGRRGFRIESARLGTRSAEAVFEDTVRQLSYAVKEAYYRVQKARRHLAVDKKIRDNLAKLLEDARQKPREEMQGEPLFRLALMAVNAEAEVIRDTQDIESATGDFRILLRLQPEVQLELTTGLEDRPVVTDLEVLKAHATKSRPDIRSKRLLHEQRKAEFRLAKAIRYPNVTVDVGYLAQGPLGPDNQQQWMFNLGAPIPVFDRNQGGIVEAGVAVQAAEADLTKMLNEVANEVTVAYRRFVHSRKLVAVYRAGVLERADNLFAVVRQSYAKGKLAIVDLENLRRVVEDTKENYIEALFGYHRDLLLLERAAGKDLTS